MTVRLFQCSAPGTILALTIYLYVGYEKCNPRESGNGRRSTFLASQCRSFVFVWAVTALPNFVEPVTIAAKR